MPSFCIPVKLDSVGVSEKFGQVQKQTMKKSLLTIATLSLLTIAPASAAVLAVNLSGDYSASSINFNNTLPGSQTGDYDFDGTADDRRTYQNIDTVLTSASPANPFASGAPTRTSTIRAGFQVANINSITDPTFSLRRLAQVVAGDGVQITNGAGTTTMRLANVTNVAKANFLGGQDAVANLSFANIAGSASGNIVTFTAVGTPLFRLAVQNGSNWYISNTSRTNAGSISVNGSTESWFAYNPTSNLFYDNSALGSSVLGSTFNDIQAFGAIALTTANFDGTSANAGQMLINNSQLTVVPEPSSFGLLFATSLFILLAVRRLRRVAQQ